MQEPLERHDDTDDTDASTPQQPVYLDHHATTPLDPRVLEAMMPFLGEVFGNASSAHPYGWEAQAAVESARAAVAELVGASRVADVVFTSGATEANNLAIFGAIDHAWHTRGLVTPRILTAPTEHPAVIDPCRHLEAIGRAEVVWLGVDEETGHLDYDEFAARLAEAPERTVLVSLMAANNEIGTLHDIERIGAAVAEYDGVLFHCDAAQAAGKIPLRIDEAHIDLLTLSAHKLYGPKGVGAILVSPAARKRLVAQQHGGGHETGLRAGTLNVPGIVGLGAACRLAQQEMAGDATNQAQLRDTLLAGLEARIAPMLVNGCRTHRLPGNLNISIPFVDGESLFTRLAPKLALSTGSACASTSLASSHVLRAIGRNEDLAQASLRLGLGRRTTDAHIPKAIDAITEVVVKLRELHPMWELYEAGEGEVGSG